ncbi:ATP-binding cassette domain-containing protein [Lactobacillus helveticus]|uniref:ATP-binding cassette domain-containing protein n=1 Tax=Lactobacillus helveticus TaxID=1587 RepID=UPI00197C646A|nr:ABC transporter ATP-binding protein [Lactobacillus helveticus]MBN6049894.1 ABC transporter ATP-binding protein [Lactobacillus helveticus]
MTLKYASKQKIFAYVLLSLIYACGNVAIAYVTKIILNLAQYKQGDIRDLIKVAIVGTAVIIAILFSNIAYKLLKNNIVKEINLYLKSKEMTYLISKNSNLQKDGLNIMTNDLKQIETLKINNELLIINEVLAFLLSIVTGLINSWQLTLIFMVTTLLPGFVQKLFTKKIQVKSRKWEKENGNYTQSVSDGLNGAVTANLYNAQKNILQKVLVDAKNMENALKSLNNAQDIANQIIIALADIFSFILPFLVGAIFMFNGQIGAGTLVMIVQLSNDFINPIVNIFGQLNQIKSTKPILEKLEPGLQYVGLEGKNKTKQPLHFNNLCVKNLSFSIKNRKIFNDLNIQVKSSEKVLLTAPSGWGKSTLLKILLGKLSPDKGEVLIDNHDITSDWEIAHNYFSYIAQIPFIFDDTLEFNITLGLPYSQKEITTAIDKAGLTDLVNEKGLDYKVGEKGQNLSGGQIQRIEITRALLSQRPIMLADEATSALDRKLSKAIHNIIINDKKLTVIEVAHNLSKEDKERFDRVLKLDEM